MKKTLFKKICIVGVGLIGGSLGLAIKKRRLAKFVVGVARREKSAISAVKMKAVDMAALNLKEGIQGADLVILAGPIPTIISQIKSLPRFLSKKAIVIDVGSSKVQICQNARRVFGRGGSRTAPTFIGCHPMAGSEKCGIQYANAELFQDSVCFVTQKNTKVQSFWRSLGAKVIMIPDKEHDAWVAKSSHLPHALSFSLFQNIDCKYPFNPSLKDLSRLAKSHPELWTDIFLSNQDEVLKAAQEFQKSFSHFQKVLRVRNKSKLIRFISQANRSSSHA